MGSKIDWDPEFRQSMPNIGSEKDESLLSLTKKWKSNVAEKASKAQELLKFGDSPVRPNMKRRNAITSAAQIKPCLLGAIQKLRCEAPASPSRKFSERQVMRTRERSVDSASSGSPSKSAARFLDKEASSERNFWTRYQLRQFLLGRASQDRASTSKVIEKIQLGKRKNI